MTNRDDACLHGKTRPSWRSIKRIVYNKTNIGNCKNNILVDCSALIKLDYYILLDIRNSDYLLNKNIHSNYLIADIIYIYAIISIRNFPLHGQP